MKTIELPHGKLTLVDDEDYEWLNQWKWHIHTNGYVVRNPYLGKPVRMHRLIANTPDGMDTDHINGNRLDNRRSNLRICKRWQNQANKKKSSNNTSGYKGVYWDKVNKNWRANIGVSGKRTHIGCFDNVEDAARAYDKKARELFGEFARTNFG